MNRGEALADIRSDFSIAATYLRQRFHAVANPFDLHVMGVTWKEAMQADITVLAACTHIYMMQGWQESKGARIEHQLAVDLGLEIEYE